MAAVTITVTVDVTGALAQARRVKQALRSLTTGIKPINLRLNATGIKQATNQVNTALRSVQRQSQATAQAVTRSGTATKNAFFGIGRQIRTFATTFLVIKSTFAVLRGIKDTFVDIVSSGIDFNSSMEDARIALTGIILQTQDIYNAQGRLVKGAEEYAAASNLAALQLQTIRTLGLKTALTTEEIVSGFQSMLGPLTAMGVELNQAAPLVTNIALAMSAAGIPARELSQEGRALLNGEISRNARLNQILRITKSELNEWKERDILAEKLNERMSGYVRAAREAEGTWSVIKSNVKEAYQFSAGKITEGLSEGLKGIGTIINDTILDLKKGEIRPELIKGMQTLSEIGKQLGKNFKQAVVGLAEDFAAMLVWVEANGTALLKWTEALGLVISQIGALIADIFKLIFVADTADKGFQNWANTLLKIASFIGLIRLGVLGIKLAFQGVQTVLRSAVLEPLVDIEEMTGNIIRAIGHFTGNELLVSVGNTILADVDLARVRFGEQVDAAQATISEMEDLVVELNQRAKDIQNRRIVLHKPPTVVDQGNTTKPKPQPPDEEDKKAKDKQLKEDEDYFKRRRELLVENLQLEGYETAAALYDLHLQWDDFYTEAILRKDSIGQKRWEEFFRLSELKLTVDEIEKQVNKASARLQNTVASIDLGVKLGTITPTQGTAKTLEAYAKAIAVYRIELAKLEAIIAKGGAGPAFEEMIDRAAELRLQLDELSFATNKLAQTFVQWSEDVSDALQQEINAGLDSIIDGTASVGQAFANMARGVIRQIAQITQKLLVMAIVQKALGALGLPIPSTTGLFGATGGYIRGPGTGTSDSVPARLSNGEYVVQAKAVSHYGADLLHLINQRRLPRNLTSVPRFAVGGLIGRAGSSGEPTEHRFHGLIEVGEGLTMQVLDSRDADKWFVKQTKRHRQAIRAVGKS